VTGVPCESALEDRLVIVLGTMRSGTSWLVQLLLAHPEVGGNAAESALFNALWDFWENAHSEYGEGVSALLGQGELAVAWRQFSDRIFLAARDRYSPEASWFVEKTPGHVDRIPLMAVTYPDAWYVHIVRDGRDVVRSILESPFGTDDPTDAAGYWVDAVRKVEQQRWRLPRFREVRYEQLVADPVGEVRGLFEWMGLAVDADVNDRLAQRAATEVSRYSSSEPIGPGKWTRFDQRVLAEVQNVAADLLADLGYLDGLPGTAGYRGRA